MNQNNANLVPTFTHNFISENMGKETQTPDGSSKIFHISGFNDQDLFFSCVNGFLWDCKFGWENKSQRYCRNWRDEFSKLSKNIQKIILFQFPDLLSIDLTELKPAARIYHVACVNLTKRGIIEKEICSRCSGSGHYSYNQMDGTRCFKCRGQKETYPSATEILRAIREFKKKEARNLINSVFQVKNS